MVLTIWLVQYIFIWSFLHSCSPMDRYPKWQSLSFITVKCQFLIQLIWVIVVMWQSDRVKSKESVLPVCAKPYHTTKRTVQKEEEIGVLRNCACSSNTCMFSYILYCLLVWPLGLCKRKFCVVCILDKLVMYL